MRVALFARYSSKMQDEMSIEAQLSEMETYAEAHGWTVVRRYLLAETRSADVEKAPEFQEMMADAKRKQFDALLLHKLDRFGRDRETSIVHKAALRRLGIRVCSVVENLGDGIMDRMMEGIIEIMAEWFSHNLGQETRKGHRSLTRKGLWFGGKVPWGIQIETMTEGTREHKRFIPDPVRGPVVREVYEMMAAGRRASDIQDHIQARCGESWHMASLYTRLRNPIYYGLIEYGKTSMPMKQKRRKQDPAEVVQGHWEGLVTKELWDAANAVLDSRASSRTHRRKPARFYLLSEGIVTCSKCKRSIIGAMFSGHPRYVCSGRRNKECGNHTVKAELLEERVHQEVLHYLSRLDVEKAIKEYENSLQPQRESAVKREGALRQKLSEVGRKMGNLVAAIEDGADVPALRTRLKELQGEESQLAQEVALAQLDADKAVQANVAVVRDYVKTVADAIQGMPPEDLKTLFQHLVRVEFDLEKKEGQLGFRLSPVSTVPLDCCLSSGRSARTRRKTTPSEWWHAAKPFTL